MPSLTIHGGEGSQQVTPGYQKVCSEDLMFLSFNRMMMLGPVMSCGGQQQDVGRFMKIGTSCVGFSLTFIYNPRVS